MSGLGKQAKILTEAQMKAAIGHVSGSRYPERDRVMILLSVKAGLRAKEIASLTWGMLTDAEGAIGDAIALENGASKGKRGTSHPYAPRAKGGVGRAQGHQGR